MNKSISVLAVSAALSLVTLAAQAEDRSEVLERIKPVGQVAVTGQPAPAAEKKAEAKPAAAKPEEAKPAAEAPKVAAMDGESRYKATCFACHATGAAGAPKLDDKANWEPRIAKGMDALYQSALNGTAKGMPPRGTCATCSDDEIKATVDYMVSQAK